LSDFSLVQFVSSRRPYFAYARRSIYHQSFNLEYLLCSRENSIQQLGQVMLFRDADDVVDAAPSRQKF
jgi:hypothetical protein